MVSIVRALIGFVLTDPFASAQSKTAETLLHHVDRERFRRIRLNVVRERDGDSLAFFPPQERRHVKVRRLVQLTQ